MLTLQRVLAEFIWESMAVFLERFIYFSLLVVIIGRAWCGWICPLGFFQDVLDWIRKKSGLGYIRFPKFYLGKPIYRSSSKSFFDQRVPTEKEVTS